MVLSLSAMERTLMIEITLPFVFWGPVGFWVGGALFVVGFWHWRFLSRYSFTLWGSVLDSSGSKSGESLFQDGVDSVLC